MHITPAGDRAILVTVPEATPAELRAFAEEMRKVADAAVVGYESVLVIGEGARRAPLPMLGRGAQRAPSPITRTDSYPTTHASTPAKPRANARSSAGVASGMVTRMARSPAGVMCMITFAES